LRETVKRSCTLPSRLFLYSNSSVVWLNAVSFAKPKSRSRAWLHRARAAV